MIQKKEKEKTIFPYDENSGSIHLTAFMYTTATLTVVITLFIAFLVLVYLMIGVCTF